MKKTYIKTKNVEKFNSLMNTLQNAPENMSKIAIVYGEPGLGKTFTIYKWALKNQAIYIRAAHNMTTCWLLRQIAEELGENPYFSTQNNYNLVIKNLKNQPKIIFVDEADYLCEGNNIIETLRDIHDVTGTPIVFVGMQNLKIKISRSEAIKDRLYQELKFDFFDKSEIEEVLNAFTDIQFSDNAINYLSTRKNQFRQIMKTIELIELNAKRNNIDYIDEIDMKGILNGRGNKAVAPAVQKIKQVYA